MRSRSPFHTLFVFLGSGLLLAGATPAHALFGLRWFSSPSKTPAPVTTPHVLQDGQKVRVYKLKKANVEDLQPPLENRLKLIKSQGFITVDAQKNELVLTDFPENLSQFDLLIREMDQVYDNPNAMARRMQATQQMLKTVRAMNLSNAAVRGGETASANQPAANPSAPTNAAGAKDTSVAVAAPGGVETSPGGAVHSDAEDEKKGVRWLAEEQPALGAFTVLGWMHDGVTTIVALRNGGQRYFYHRGRLHIGRVKSTACLNDYHAALVGDRLIISHRDEGRVSISINPKKDREALR